MKNRLTLVLFTTLLIALGVFVFLYLTEKSDRLSAESQYADEKKKELRELSDSLNIIFESKIEDFELEIEYLSNLEQDIKYVPYEKLRYTDVTVDSALDTISVYSFDSRARN